MNRKKTKSFKKTKWWERFSFIKPVNQW